MKRVIRFFICFFVSFVAVYLSGYGYLMNDISDSLAATVLLGASSVLSIFAFLLLETYLTFKTKIIQLSKRIDELEKRENQNKWE